MASHALTLPNPDQPTALIIFVNLSQCKTLTPTNYQQWAAQITSFLQGFDLFHYLDGTHPCPPKTVTTADTTIINPAHHTWVRQDRLLFGSLIGTLDNTISPLVTHTKSSHEAWSILSATYANPSRGHILQIKNRLESITKSPDQTITDYMHQIKTATLELANLGKPMDPEDITAKVLRGLDPKQFRVVIETVEARDTPISFEALHEKLLHHTLTNKEPPSNTLPASAFAAHFRPHHTSRFSPRAPASPLLSTPSLPQKLPEICQFCNFKGHSFPQCRNFKRLHPNFSLIPFTRSPRPNSNRPQVHTVTSASSSSPSWLVDSGASHHITNDLSNLALHAPYDGTDDVLIGDGSSLPISNIGSFTSSTSSSSPLCFNNVLHVPLISRNILSVSQFCLDNNANIEFTSSSFFFKDTSTGRILLQGKLERGVYSWKPASPQTFLATLSSSLLWHHRLGHPSSNIFAFLKNHFDIPISSSYFNFCNSCKINKCHKLPFSTSSLTSHAPLELIFSDVWSSPIKSHDDFKYYVIFVDHFTKYTWLYPLKLKLDTYNVFHRFKAHVEKYIQRPILQFFSDNGGEFIKITASLLQDGVSHLTSPPHTPEHNKYAEDRHRHIV